MAKVTRDAAIAYGMRWLAKILEDIDLENPYSVAHDVLRRIKELKTLLRDEGLTPEDIGTTQTVIDGLPKAICASVAKGWLDIIRKNLKKSKDIDSTAMQLLADHMRQGGITAQELEIIEPEIIAELREYEGVMV